MSVQGGLGAEHELGAPVWVRSRDFVSFPAGGGYEVRCQCGWRSPLRTTSALAWIAATSHLAELVGPGAELPAAPPVATTLLDALS